MRQKRKFKLQQIIIYGYVLPFFILIFVASAFLYYSNKKNAVIQTSSYTLAVLEELNHSMNRDVTQIIDLSYYVCNQNQVKTILSAYSNLGESERLLSEQQLVSFLQAPFQYKPEVTNMNVYLEGKQYYGSSSNSAIPLEYVKDAQWFEKVKGELQYVGENQILNSERLPFVKNRTEHEKVITVFTALYDNNGEIRGYLSVDISKQYLYRDMLEKQQYNEESKIYLINNLGEVVIESDFDEIGQPLPLHDSEKIIESQKGGRTEIKLNRQRHVAIYTGFGSQGWRTIEVIPTKALFTMKSTFWWLVFGLVAILFFFLLTTYLILRRNVLQPIDRLSHVMQNYKISDAEIKMGNDTVEEIEVLYLSYNMLQDKIHTLMRDIEQEHSFRRQADIKVLQNQINPHFLYNTLDSINWLTLGGDTEQAGKIVVSLSQLMRLSLNSGQSICTLRDEIEHIRLYMELQKMCNKDCFQYVLEISDISKNLYIPKLLLQPIVENSILHGFEYIRDGGLIRISADIFDGNLKVVLSDNGQGISEEALDTLWTADSKKGHFGIKNIKERMRYLYGYAASLTYDSQVGAGTIVTVMIPAIDDRDWYDRHGI